MTSIVDAVRQLFAGQPVTADLWVALAWCVGILLIAYLLANAIYRRQTS